LGSEEIQYDDRVYLKIGFRESIMKIVKIGEVKPEERLTPLFTGPVSSQPIITTQMRKQFIKLHSHTSEQVLIVTKGRGIVATETEQVKVGPGAVIVFASGEKH
jgi:quercetin dioxygenase-like cupin family protein